MILQCRAARCTERPSSRVAPTAQPIISIPGHYPRSETYAVFNCEWSSSSSSSSSKPPSPPPLALPPRPFFPTLESLPIFAFTREAARSVEREKPWNRGASLLRCSVPRRRSSSSSVNRNLFARRLYKVTRIHRAAFIRMRSHRCSFCSTARLTGHA